MFGIDPEDVRYAAGRRGRFICLLCGRGFDTQINTQICPDCIAREPTPIQDNDAPDGGWIKPREAPEITVARKAREDAERAAQDYRRAMLFLHQVVTSIAGAADRPLRLFPRDQHRLARLMLEQFAKDFPQIVASMDLYGLIESEIVHKDGMPMAGGGSGGEYRSD
jgi:hypothetical protein